MVVHKRFLLAIFIGALPSISFADGCLILQDGSEPWDHVDRVVEVRPMTVMTVVRFDSTWRRGTIGAARQKWTDDIPSETLGVDAICDRVQLESAYPLNGEGDRPIAMIQGERLNHATDLDAFPDLKTRLDAEGRLMSTQSGAVFLMAVNLEEPDWRPKLLNAASEVGEIEEDRWMIGLPGGLYMVPLKP